MKQKNIDEEVVTKGYLKSILKIEFNEFRQEIDDKARGYRDEILTRLDDVMGKFETFRENSEIGTHQTRELREEIDDHEKRIKRLEKPQQ